MRTKTLFDRTVELYSQPATWQDEWVIGATHGLTRGYFVECGAHNGLQDSNTLALEQSFGWTGLLIEADPDLSAQARINRPNCQHATCALYVTDGGDMDFTCGDLWGGITAFLPAAWPRDVPKIRAATRTLSSLLVSTEAPPVIDYFSLDIEGTEVAVLHEFFQRPTHQFRCLTVEYREDARELMRLQRILEPHGYVLDRVQAWDAFFYHAALLSKV